MNLKMIQEPGIAAKPPSVGMLVMLAGISAMSMSIFLPSLQAMTVYFETDYSVIQLAVSGYLASVAVLQIIIGPLADRFGRRPVLLGAMAIFAIASIGAAVSTSVVPFLIFRFSQAVVAAGMVLSRTIVRDIYDQDRAASMIGYVTMGMALIPMVGPMVGGILDQFFGWQSSFYLLGFAAIVVLLLCIANLPETRPTQTGTFRDQIRDYPGLLTSPRFWGYVLSAAFASGAFFALLGGTSFVAGIVFGLSPFWAGVALGSPAIGYAFGNFISGRYSVRVGIDKMCVIGSSISTIGLGISLALALLGLQHPLIFFGFCTLLGVGNGILLPSATSGSLSVRPQLAGTASGLGGAIMIAGGAVLSAFAGSLLDASSGAIPLQILMFATSILAIFSSLYVVRRNKALG